MKPVPERSSLRASRTRRKPEENHHSNRVLSLGWTGVFSQENLLLPSPFFIHNLISHRRLVVAFTINRSLPPRILHTVHNIDVYNHDCRRCQRIFLCMLRVGSSQSVQIGRCVAVVLGVVLLLYPTLHPTSLGFVAMYIKL